jgi:hypothetical protein
VAEETVVEEMVVEEMVVEEMMVDALVPGSVEATLLVVASFVAGESKMLPDLPAAAAKRQLSSTHSSTD